MAAPRAISAIVCLLLAFGMYLLARQRMALQSELRALHAENNALRNQITSLRETETNKSPLTTPPIQMSSGTGSPSSELLKLRAEVGRLRDAAGDRQIETAIQIWAANVSQLRRSLEQMPEKRIPELQFVNEKDWADAVWDQDLSTEDGIREALSKLRDRAVNKFFDVLRPALNRYIEENGGALPNDLADVKRYMSVEVDDSVFQRYELVQKGKVSDDPGQTLVRLVSHVDDDYDSEHEMVRNGASGGRFNRVEGRVQDAARAYAERNNGALPKSPADLQPFLQTPMEPATVSKYLNRIEPPFGRRAE